MTYTLKMGDEVHLLDVEEEAFAEIPEGDEDYYTLAGVGVWVLGDLPHLWLELDSDYDLLLLANEAGEVVVYSTADGSVWQVVSELPAHLKQVIQKWQQVVHLLEELREVVGVN